MRDCSRSRNLRLRLFSSGLDQIVKGSLITGRNFGKILSDTGKYLDKYANVRLRS
jgi:hypothetical protein